MMEFSAKDCLYTVNGEEVEYVAKIDGQHFARRIYECEDYETGPFIELGPMEHFPSLYVEPPVSRLHDDIKRLREDKERATKELVAIREQIREAESSRIDIQAEAEKREEFRLLLDYLDDKITHVILPGWSGCKIEKLEEILEREENWNGGGRYPVALGLFAVPNPIDNPRRERVTWKVNAYGDGSGPWKNFIPCYSEEDAREKIQVAFDSAIEQWRKDGKTCDVNQILESNNWIQPPKDWTDFIETKRRERLESRVDKLQKDLDEAKSELKAVQQ